MSHNKTLGLPGLLQPPDVPPLPDMLQIGEFTLVVGGYSPDLIYWDAENNTFCGVSGSAWLTFDGVTVQGMLGDSQIGGEYPHFVQNLHVVASVTNAQTQIDLVSAQRIQPGIQLGETFYAEVALSPDALQRVVAGEVSLVDLVEESHPKGQVLVRFEQVDIKIPTPIMILEPTPAVERRPSDVLNLQPHTIGRIVRGSAFYSSDATMCIPSQLKISLEGFTLNIHRLTLTPDGATANIAVQLPGGLVEQDTCCPAALELHEATITQRCELYVMASEAEFGPWIVGDSGLVITGTGYTLDLSTSRSPTGRLHSQDRTLRLSAGDAVLDLRPMMKPPIWRGLVLHSGRVSGEDLIPDPANTGYLRGQFAFYDAELTIMGLSVYLILSQPHEFNTLHPLYYRLVLEGGWLRLKNSQVMGGAFGPGQIDAYMDPHLFNGEFKELTVDSNLDLVGDIYWGDCGRWLNWGKDNYKFSVLARRGSLYLPASPLPTFCPVDANDCVFIQPAFREEAPFSYQEQIKNYGISGLTLSDFCDLEICSPDRHGGISRPLCFAPSVTVSGWLRLSGRGVDGELRALYNILENAELGQSTRPGYVSDGPFQIDLFHDAGDDLLAQFCSSAVFESSFGGWLKTPEPTNFYRLDFSNMQLTSGACFVGGYVDLPPEGMTLDYWQLRLVPTSDGAGNRVGVISICTGQIVFCATDIREPVHFDEPLRLIWGEMRADGNIGELFFNYNNHGQRFDHIPFVPHHIMLSRYVADGSLGYLATCGTVHLDYFGPQFVNLRDAVHHDSSPPYYGRYVTSPKIGEVGWPVTDLHLAKTWHDLTGDQLAIFDFPDSEVNYCEDTQRGFRGKGTSRISFFRFDGMPSTINIQHDSIDIRLGSNEEDQVTHCVDLGLYAPLGRLTNVRGCARIEGPLLSRVSFFGLLEVNAPGVTSVLSCKSGFMVEVNITTTPNSLDIAVAGDMLLQIAGAALDISASAHLLFDFRRRVAEGEVIGRFDCNTVLGGLDGEGQITWHAGPAMQYLQGRIKIHLCGWTNEGWMEGGLFIGHNVNRTLAWVLHTDSPHFGVSDAILPDRLTGLFGYGRLSFSVDWYILGGGIDVYAGMGAFSEGPPGLLGIWAVDWSQNPALGLPYVIGSCGIFVRGEILGGLVSASAWADLDLRGPIPIYYEGSLGLEGCVLWLLCASIDVRAGFGRQGFYLA